MVKHRLTRAPKLGYARAVLGAAVLTTAFGAHAAAPASASVKSPAAYVITDEKHTTQSHTLKAKVTAAQVLSVAAKQIGTKENANGGGTKFQKWYMNSPRAMETVKRDGGSKRDYLNAAWCAMFVSWVGEQTGARPTVGWDAYTVTYAKWFKNNHRWGQTPKPGAVVYYAWSGSKDLDDIDHVGFVVKNNHNGTITTIEGNTGNGEVERRVRPTSQVVGYGYPDYAS
ncbi:CHAP domain-containing protein [Nonomuraea sediminis]|uniref:CHAP domain-containing protein n=1 Tax=Nonomuraea sediminis TaxID=2835864 RepID=UPI001BDC5687|nr:CHAP domain-containing protein [Nonomuraea sediminis]